MNKESLILYKITWAGGTANSYLATHETDKQTIKEMIKKK